MQGRTLSIIGILLTLGSASVFTGTAAIIAQKRQPASEAGVEKAEETHEARRTPRLVAKQTTWRAIAIKKNPTATALPSLPTGTSTKAGGERPTDLAGGPVADPERKRGAMRTFLPAVDQPDIQERHKIIATEVLGLLPETCQRRIQNFYVRYEKPERRGLAGKSTIILDGTLPDKEFRAVLIHEAMGHLFDLGCLTGSADTGRSAFLDGSDPVFNDDPSLAFYRISWTDAKTRKVNSRSGDFVTGYAETDPFEDLAESAIYYVLQNRAFTERARNNRVLAVKLKWFQTFLPVPPQQDDTAAAAWDGSIPWDATKLTYVWNTPSIVARQ